MLNKDNVLKDSNKWYQNQSEDVEIVFEGSNSDGKYNNYGAE